MSLSDEMTWTEIKERPEKMEMYHERDVKQAVKELKKIFTPTPRSFLTEIGSSEICRRIDEIFGEELI